MKIIKINSCKNCPYQQSYKVCNNRNSPEAFIDDIDAIPNWCPLEDDEKMNQEIDAKEFSKTFINNYDENKKDFRKSMKAR